MARRRVILDQSCQTTPGFCFARERQLSQHVTNWLLLFLSPPVFAYYSGPDVDHGYGSLTVVIVSSEFPVCTLITILHDVRSELTDTSQSGSRLQPGVPHIVALCSSVIKPIAATGVCPIVDGTWFNMASSLKAWSAINCED